MALPETATQPSELADPDRNQVRPDSSDRLHQRLDNFDVPELAKIAIEKYDLYEEAFMIYRKVGMDEEAIEVLSNLATWTGLRVRCEDHVSDRLEPTCGGLLENGQVDSGIEYYIKAQDTTNCARGIGAAQPELR